jgi:hypothetical protein
MKRPRSASLVRYAAAILSAALFSAPCTSHAEDRYAAYDSLSLRVKVGFWGVTLVEGQNETRLTGLGSYPSRAPADLMAARSPEAARLYLDYRTHEQVGSTFVWLGFAAWIGSIVAVVQQTPSGDNLAEGLFWGGFAGIVIGGIIKAESADKIHKAVWTYNRTLAGPAQSPP